MMEYYKPLSILKKLPLSIESSFAYDDYLLVGTKEGHLLMYKLDIKHKSPSEFELRTHLLRSAKQFSKKSIIQIQAIPEHRILISLSDNLISVHNLDKISFPLISTIAKTKGASHFSLDVHRTQTLTGEIQCTVRLCAVVKYNLMFFYWKNNDFFELRPSIKLSNIARAVVWYSNLLYVGLRNQYIQVSIDSGAVKELFSMVSEPIILPLSENGLALCRDKQTYIFDNEGRPLLDYAISWTDLPLSIADDSLYLLAVQSDSNVEVLTNSSKKITFIQQIELSSLVNRPLKSIIKWRNRPGQLILYSENDVVVLKSVPYEQQVRLLQEAKHFELALKIVEHYSNDNVELDGEVFDPSECEKLKLKIRNLHALELFCAFKFSEAIALFQSLDTDPSYVIGLYPDLLPDDFRARCNYSMPLPKLEGALLENGLLALIDYLLEVRRRLTKNISSGKVVATEQDVIKLQSIIDTSLLKCYLQTNDALVAPLLRIPDNHCHLEEVEKALKKRQKYNELIILYKTKGLHRNALELLQRIAKYEGNPTQGRRKLIQYLQELGSDNIDLIFEYSEWILREYADEGLQIFTDDIMLELDSAVPREQVLVFLDRINPNLTINYLDHCIFNWNETSPKFHDTLINKYREKIRSLMAIYQLELHQQKNANAIEILDENISSSPNNTSPGPEDDGSSESRDYYLRPEPAGQEPGDLGQLRRKLMHLLEESDHYTTETLPTYLLHDGLFDERAIVMGKIGNHREALVIYVHILNDLQRAEEYCLRQFYKPDPKNGAIFNNKDVFYIFFEQCLTSLASLNSVDGQLKSHLQKFDPRLLPRAQLPGFLAKTHQMLSDDESSIYNELAPNVRTALAILARHSTRINLLRSIEMLPASLPLGALTTILSSSMRHLTSRKNYVQILRQLLHAQRLRVQESRINIEQTNRIMITDMDNCHVCMKKIGKSVFVRYINKDLVHLGCREMYEQTMMSTNGSKRN